MVLVINDANVARCGDVMEKVYRFRHALFVERLKREEGRRGDGREIDRFDGPGCVHLVRMAGGAVTAYSRLLPTTRPHLLADVYPHLAQGVRPPRGPRVYEWTRCGTLPCAREGRAGAADPALAEIATAAAELAEARGLDGLLTQIHPILVNRLMSCGWDVEPLGLPARHLGEPILTVYARLTPETVAASRRFFGLAAPVLDRGAATEPAPAPIPFPPSAGTEIRLRA